MRESHPCQDYFCPAGRVVFSQNATWGIYFDRANGYGDQNKEDAKMKVSAMMRWWLYGLACLVFVAVSGCTMPPAMNDLDAEGWAAAPGKPIAATSAEGPLSADTTAGAGRMLAWAATLAVDVPDIAEAMDEVKRLTGQMGGYVQAQSGGDDHSAEFTLRLPVSAFQNGVAALEKLGEVTRRNVGCDDVTERCIDTEAQLKNAIALRDRLKQLLDRARTVDEVLIVERELTRVQSQIDSLSGRLKALRGRVSLATVHLSLRRRSVPGPVTVVFQGLGWTLKKLFVWRD
jgi:hypothetical protein